MDKIFPKVLLIVFLIFHLYTRFGHLEDTAIFKYDQVHTAWAAYNILVEKHYPLLGGEAKNNSGLFIGPLYYYLISIVYYFTHLDPIASPIFAGLCSLVSFLTLYIITKKLFTHISIPLIALFIYEVGNHTFVADKVEWIVNLVPAISFIILYFLYKVIEGNPKYLIPLAVSVGLSFHIHFTSIYYPIIIFLTLPFFPKTKKTIQYMFISLPIFFVFLTPGIVYNLQSHNRLVNGGSTYFSTYYHGFHLRRFFQLLHDAFIKFQAVVGIGFLDRVSFIYYVIFLILAFIKKQKSITILAILYGLWILVPWIIFTTYKGELTDYYFNSTIFIVISLLAFLLYQITVLPTVIPKLLVLGVLFYYGYLNIPYVFHPVAGNLIPTKMGVKQAIQNGQRIEFQEGNGSSYIYYISTYKRSK